MKRYIFLVTLVAFVLFGSYLWAAPPVCPPFEGFYIETTTDMVVFGAASDTENFDWHWNNDDCRQAASAAGIGGGALAAGESEARITYSEEFDSSNAYGGAAVLVRGVRGAPLPDELPPTTFGKHFIADSHPDGNANLDVEVDIGYTSDGVAGHHADFREVASEEVVSAGLVAPGNLFAGVLSLCPWGINANQIWPATNEGIAMGSQFAIPAQLANANLGTIDFSSDTEVGVTKGVYMNYDVDAANGKGRIEAQMIARLYEGSAVQVQGTPNATPLNSVVTYSEQTLADGIFTTFHKNMNYRAKFAAPEPVSIGIDILQ